MLRKEEKCTFTKINFSLSVFYSYFPLGHKIEKLMQLKK